MQLYANVRCTFPINLEYSEESMRINEMIFSSESVQFWDQFWDEYTYPAYNVITQSQKVKFVTEYVF